MERNYSIKIPHFYSFEYYEDDRKMVLELDFRDEVLYLTPTMIKNWEEPFDKLKITYEEKLRILHHIRECLLDRWRPEEVVIDVEPRKDTSEW